jgi:predicted PurR-regulated permease PerM
MILFALLVYLGWSFIGTVVVSFFLYYGTRPFYRRLFILVKNRSLAAGFAIVLVSLPVILFASYTSTIGYRELNRFLSNVAGGSIEDFLSPFIDTELLDAVSQILQSPAQAITEGLSPGLASDLFQFTLNSISFAGMLGLHLFIVLVVSFYLLRDGYKLRHWLYDEFELSHTVADQFFRAVDQDFHRIFFGNLLNAIVTGLIGAIMFSLVNIFAPSGYQVPYPTLLGLLCGVTSLIPVIGMKLVYVPATSFLLAQMAVDGQATELFWFPALFAAVAFVIVDSIPDFVLRPYISGRNLHIGALMVAYIIGPLFFGWYGLFLAPMLLVLLFHYANIVFPVVHRQPLPEQLSEAQRTLSEFVRKEL